MGPGRRELPPGPGPSVRKPFAIDIFSRSYHFRAAITSSSRPSANLGGLPASPGFGLKQKVRDLEARMAKEIREAREDVELAKQAKIGRGNGLSRSEAEAYIHNEIARRAVELVEQPDSRGQLGAQLAQPGRPERDLGPIDTISKKKDLLIDDPASMLPASCALERFFMPQI